MEKVSKDKNITYCTRSEGQRLPLRLVRLLHLPHDQEQAAQGGTDKVQSPSQDLSACLIFSQIESYQNQGGKATFL